MKEKKELTPEQIVYRDAKVARTENARIDWEAKEIATDMLLITKKLAVDLEKFIRKGMESPARRVRRGTKALETLGKAFRIQSVKEAKNGKF